MKRHDLIWLIGTLLAAGAFMAAFTLGLRNGGLGFLGLGMVSIVALTVRDIIERSHMKKARQEGMRQAATRLGFAFRETAPWNVLGWSESFHLTRHGMETQQAVDKSLSPALASVLTPKASNVLERSIKDAAVAVFDYVCDRSKSDDVTTQQTVFAVHSPTLEFPHYALVPAGWWDRLVGQFGRNIALRGPYRLISKETDAFGSIDERLFALLDGRRCLEAGEGFLLLYRRDRLLAPQDLDELVRTGLEVHSILSREMSLR
jgi:hypothetical protein